MHKRPDNHLAPLPGVCGQQSAAAQPAADAQASVLQFAVGHRWQRRLPLGGHTGSWLVAGRLQHAAGAALIHVTGSLVFYVSVTNAYVMAAITNLHLCRCVSWTSS